MTSQQMPKIGDYFRHPNENEWYKITLIGQHCVWVDVLDFKRKRIWRNRPYLSPTAFIKEMIPVDKKELSRFGIEMLMFMMIEKYMKDIYKF